MQFSNLFTYGLTIIEFDHVDLKIVAFIIVKVFLQLSMKFRVDILNLHIILVHYCCGSLNPLLPICFGGVDDVFH